MARLLGLSGSKSRRACGFSPTRSSNEQLCWLKLLRASSRDGGGGVTGPPSPRTMLLSRHTRRREVIALLGGGAIFGPRTGIAQPTGPVRRIGLLSPQSVSSAAPLLAGLRQGLRDLGWIEGRNIVFELRYADGRIDHLPGLAAELVRRNVDVIVAGSNAGALAAKQATGTIPIVMATTGNPIAGGLAETLARPVAGRRAHQSGFALHGALPEGRAACGQFLGAGAADRRGPQSQRGRCGLCGDARRPCAGAHGAADIIRRARTDRGAGCGESAAGRVLGTDLRLRRWPDVLWRRLI